MPRKRAQAASPSQQAFDFGEPAAVADEVLPAADVVAAHPLQPEGEETAGPTSAVDPPAVPLSPAAVAGPLPADAPATFDVFSPELSGELLIEASAGTGKTWTIAGLYVRLIVERGLPVDQVLVVTFTKAATAELRERIRARLATTLGAFQRAAKGAASGDAFLDQLVARVPDEARGNAERRLTAALQAFDLAAIHTIHGFCQRVLRETAFEAGLGFEYEVETSDAPLVAEIVDDFWRRRVATADRPWLDWLASLGETPETWRGLIKPLLGRPGLQVAPPAAAGGDDALEVALAEARRLWAGSRDEVAELLLTSPGLKRTPYNKKNVPSWCDKWSDLLTAPPLVLTSKQPETLARLTHAGMAEAAVEGQALPDHPFFAAAAVVLNAYRQRADDYAARRLHLLAELVQWATDELPHRAEQRGWLTFSEQLNRLDAALGGPRADGNKPLQAPANSAGRLVARLRERYRAALIDEFQDTDPVQYRIFRRIFGSTATPIDTYETGLFDGAEPGEPPAAAPFVAFVGDPKQAIYAFRGADVYAYLAARAASPQCAVLGRNHRSVPALVQAVNRLFASPPAAPLVEPRIDFHAVAALDPPRLALADQAGPAAALVWHWLGGDEPLDKGSATALAVGAVADEIARLVVAGRAGHARLVPEGKQEEARPLQPGDIAVLVVNHRQAAEVETALRARGLPCVRRARDNVFHTLEAWELSLVLAAIAEPNGPGLRAGLATTLWGWSGADLAALEGDDRRLDALLLQIERWRRRWRERGLMPMLYDWLAANNVAARLLSWTDGERRLTNLLHLAELLHAAGHRQASIGGLLAWFAAARDEQGEDEERLLRLESDAARIQVVTIHVSKGLEYPVVFCPFLWDGALRADPPPVLAHDEDDQAVADFGSPQFELRKRRARAEGLAERLRLAYVALTRATSRCYVAWGNVRSGKGREPVAATSALAWLLHRPGAAEDPVAAIEQAFNELEGPALRERLTAMAAVEGALVVDIGNGPAEAGPETAAAAGLEAGSAPWDGLASAALQRALPIKRVGSFTSLTAGGWYDLPDYDDQIRGTVAEEQDLAAVPAPSAVPAELANFRSAHDLPGGADTGVMLHSLFETIDFAASPAEAAPAVLRGLAATQLDPRWESVVSRLVMATLAKPLAEAGVALADLPPAARRAEMSFLFPVAELRRDALAATLRDPANGLAPPLREAAAALRFEPLEGYLKGYIDLVFEAGGRYWIVDYKSNRLGADAAAYDPEALTQAIADEHYDLQYLLYTLAVHRWLRTVVPGYRYETHFGGVYYLFLRGIAEGQGRQGVYFDRPDERLIDALDRLMATGR